MTWLIAKLGDYFAPLLIGVISLMLVAIGVQTLRYDSSEREKDREETMWAEQRALADAAALKQTQQFRAQEQAWQQTQLKAEQDAELKVTQARADAAAANTAADKLRTRFNTALATSRSSPSNPTVARNSQAETPDGLLANVFSQVVEQARLYAAIADDALVRGEQCQASYPVNSGGAETGVKQTSER